MFAPAILPFQITVVVILTLSAVSVALLRRRGCSHTKAAAFAVVGSVAAFLPALIGIGMLVELVRYGRHTYHNAREIKDPYIRIPKSATDVTVFKYASYHDAKFTAREDAMIGWLESISATPSDNSKDFALYHRRFPPRFAEYEWIYSSEFRHYNGPSSPRGASLDVWYSAEREMGYVSAGYW